MAALQKILGLSRPVLSALSVVSRAQRASLSSVLLSSQKTCINIAAPTCLNKCYDSKITQTRSYAGPPPMDKKSIGDRILLTLRLYDKVDPEKVSLESRFKEDLGLDSLDHVEVVMAVEDEFGFEIPDQDAEHLLTPTLIVQYICDKFDIFE